MPTKKKANAAVLACEAKGGAMINGKCLVVKKASQKKSTMKALKIKAKF